jgi:hypothetical protein
MRGEQPQGERPGMTTKITVGAHAGWPVRVTVIDKGCMPKTQIVEPNAAQDFHVWDTRDLRVHEIQPGEELAAAPAAEGEPILQFFAWAHLPERLQDVSRPFGELANGIVETLPRNPERTVALRKLLEAKDAAVRAKLFK